jgi:nitrite reductase/ring-hydroxylating ferredoxin subunit
MTAQSDSNARISGWWTLARSEEVTGKKPLSADLGDQPVVLWRDKQGTARALEDRCPHRRAPLSLGCVRDNGWIQCGYHGWSYDGATGRLVEIPNMKSDQRFPPLYRATNFAVAESGGFVRVNLDANAPAPPALAETLPLHGTAHVALDQDRYVDALFDDPGLLIGIRGVHFTPYLMSELKLSDGRLVMERSCQWRVLRAPAPFSADFPLSLLTSTDPQTGETELVLRDTGLRELLRAVLAPTPAARGVTAIRWRARVGRDLEAPLAKQLAIGVPFHVRAAIDAAALRVLKPTVSQHGHDLRRSLVHATATAA